MMTTSHRKLAGWGRFPVRDCDVYAPANAADVASFTVTVPVIARGNGRSYGDASLGAPGTIDAARLDRMIAFDRETGICTCEAGVLLSDIVELFAPRGWFPPVTPGTKFVTIGGMIASDVHGKNHVGSGSFGRHVLSFDLALGDGRVLTCSRDEHADLFRATCGGMGLTGVVLRATFQMIPIESAWISQVSTRTADLDETLALLETSDDFPYSVAWIDCLARGAKLGRSVVIKGAHARRADLPAERGDAPFTTKARKTKAVPIDFPSFALNGFTVQAFNELYYRAQKEGAQLVDFETYFYPLDALHHWNRIYGAKGFVQFQCVLPLATSAGGIRRLLEEISQAHTGSFLSVLKRLGEQGDGLMSFPMPGHTLALDFPARAGTFELLRKLDAIVIELGGRIYLTKDSSTDPRTIVAGYPHLPEFREVRRRYDVDNRFASALSRRLAL